MAAFISILAGGSGATQWTGATSGTVVFNQKAVTWDGTFAYQINPTTSGIGYVQVCMVGADGSSGVSLAVSTSAYIGFALNIGTLPATEEPIFEAVATSTTTLRVTVTSGGILKVYNTAGTLVATGTTVLGQRQNGWDYIEVQFSQGSSGAYAVRINGVSEVSGTTNQGTANITSPRVGKTANLHSNSVNYYYSGIYIHDTAFQGPVKFLQVPPSANGTTMAWTQGTNTSDYTQVQSLPRDITKYVMSTTTGGDVALFRVPDPLAVGYSGGTILTTMLACDMRDNVATASSEQIRIVSGASTKQTLSRDNNAVESYSLLYSDTDPATSAAWTLAALQAVQVGAIENTAAMQERCTTVAWHVAYTPTPPSGGLMMAS